MDCEDEVLRTYRKTARLDHQFENKKCIVCGEDQPSEGLSYMSNGDGTCFVAVGTCLDENVVIPAYSPKGEVVTQIKAYAFLGYTTIKSVQIPETVTVIGAGAFRDCANLESINLPSKITIINSYTFSGCQSLKEITIPSGVYKIGVEAFADCISCEGIVIPASVTTIGKFAFKNFSRCEGTVVFEVHDGWRLYDDSGNWVDVVDFKNGLATPVLYLTFLRCDYTWKRV
ncbi:MAG: leucine-rich repeat domain-containing protein [Clostridia bacterium]|nr:leucine-rich repeat domain-containing protein [Clostridia bacterium]